MEYFLKFKKKNPYPCTPMQQHWRLYFEISGGWEILKILGARLIFVWEFVAYPQRCRLKHSYKQAVPVWWQNYELHRQWTMEVADIFVRSIAPWARGRNGCSSFINMYAGGNYRCRCAIDINMDVNIMRPMFTLSY